MVPVDSSAARMPRPGATIASATLFNSVRFIGGNLLQIRRRRSGRFVAVILFYPRAAAGVGDTRKTLTPGSVLPSSDSRKAPPAVDTWLSRLVTPAALSAATVSPP